VANENWAVPILEDIPMEDFFPSCNTVHPLLREITDEMFGSTDIEDMWENWLTDLQQQLRVCLVEEMKYRLIPLIKDPTSKRIISENFDTLASFIIAAAWISYDEIREDFNE
jgi:hypothetical protein